MASVNRVLLIGNVGKDPEIRSTAKGTKVANFSLATQRRIKKDEDWENVTDWHSITAYSKSAEICEKYITKGKQVFVEGSLRNDSWEGKDGRRQSKTVIIVNNLQLLGKREDSKRDSSPATEAKPDYSDEDIPF